MNKVFIVGNLTRDPELRSTRDGISVCSTTPWRLTAACVMRRPVSLAC